MLVKVGAFTYLANIVILNCEVFFKVPIILRNTFLAACCALVNMEKGQTKFRLNN